MKKQEEIGVFIHTKTLCVSKYALRDYLKENENITKMDTIRILNENLPKDESNRFQRIELTKPKLLEYFPPFYTKPQMENVIFSLLEQWKKENEKENT